jgi:dTDP-4-dehydrorhamnose reductase
VRILVTGAAGMLGQALVPVLQADHQVRGIDIEECDLRDEAAVLAVVKAHRPGMVMHLAAYTDVDGCETDPRRAAEVNADGTRNVAKACAQIGAGILYISTDYVFDGRQDRPYREEDRPNPLNVYGRSKLLGEQCVQALVERHTIVRTSWLFGPRGKNFVSTILRLAQQRPELRVVSDQRGSPTYTRHLAAKLAQLVEGKACGLCHVTGSGSCSWFEFAQSIVDQAGFREVRVVPVSSEEAARPAPRPANSVLESRRLRQLGLGLLPPWQEGLAQYLQERRQAGELPTSPEKQRGETVGSEVRTDDLI